MTSLKDGWDRFCRTCTRLGKKTGDAVSIQKLKLDISACEDDMEALYINLGKLSYENMKDTAGTDSEIGVVVAAIREKQEEIGKIKEEIAAVQAKQYCPNCNALLRSSDRFCCNCGYRVPDEEGKVEDAADRNPAAAESQPENPAAQPSAQTADETPEESVTPEETEVTESTEETVIKEAPETAEENAESSAKEESEETEC